MSDHVLESPASFGATESLPDGFTSTFTGDFNIAEALGGKDAVEDTFKRAMESWGDDIRYMATLCIVTNAKCWQHYEKGDAELSETYAEMYYAVMNHVYDDESPFGKESISYFFECTD